MPYARQLADGQRIVLEVSDSARTNPGQASEEVLMLEQFKSLGLAVSASDPQAIVTGERWIQERIQDEVRRAVEKAIAETTARMGMTDDLADRVSAAIADPTNVETRTFHDALKAFCQHLEKTGKKQEGGGLAPSPRNYIRWAKQLQSDVPDFQIWELDRTRIEELIAHWRNRPVSDKTGQNISPDYAKHLLTVIAIFIIPGAPGRTASFAHVFGSFFVSSPFLVRLGPAWPGCFGARELSAV